MALILWSGGLDSSLVLSWCLKNWFGGYRGWGKYELTSAPRALTIINNQLGEMMQQKEEKARVKLIKKFKRKNWEFEHITIKIDSGNSYDGCLPQPLLWLTQAALVIKNNEQLFIGWIREDDATAHLYELKQIWEKLTILNSDEKTSINLPLRLARKHEVIEECKEEGIYSSCWWCGNPTKAGRKCGQCESCLKMIASEAIIAQKRKHANKKLCVSNRIGES